MSLRTRILRLWERVVGQPDPDRTWAATDHALPAEVRSAPRDAWSEAMPAARAPDPDLGPGSPAASPLGGNSRGHADGRTPTSTVAGVPLPASIDRPVLPVGPARFAAAVQDHGAGSPVETAPLGDLAEWLRPGAWSGPGPAEAAPFDPVDLVALPEPGAFHAPGSDDDAPHERPAAKAASIVQHLFCRTQAEQRLCLDWLTGLFTERPHPATYRALRELVENGMEWDRLRDIAALRDYWAERSEWWSMRWFDRLQREFVVTRMRAGPQLLSWRLAGRICERRADYPVECMIEDEWYEEWLALRPGEPGFSYFVQYLALRVLDADHTALAI